MNLKQVYEIFYPGRNSNTVSVWNKKPPYRSKKDFFEELIPMEIRWLNIKLWNDKARRSRFWADSKTENKYTTEMKKFILQSPSSIPRMEGKGKQLLQEHISEEEINKVFFEILEREQIELASDLKRHLIDINTGKLNREWGNVLAFLFLVAIFPEEVNQLYKPYLYWKENGISYQSEKRDEKKGKKDAALFQYEYPPDMSVYRPGELIHHTWVVKNVGEIPWKDRYYECLSLPFPIGEENSKIRIPRVVYPGELVSVSVRFTAPDRPGCYVMNWKMKDRDGNLSFLDKLGVGLHFTILETPDCEGEACNGDNYKILEESPAIPATLIAGKIYSHSWVIQNTGKVTWKDYYCECINGECFRYTKNELRVPLKKRVEPGECIAVNVEFVTPPVEGIYHFIWKIMKKDGTNAFGEERQLEILLNLI